MNFWNSGICHASNFSVVGLTSTIFRSQFVKLGLTLNQKLIRELSARGSSPFTSVSSPFISISSRNPISLMPGEEQHGSKEEEISIGVAPLPPEDSANALARDGNQPSLPQASQLLSGREDLYDGIIVDPSSIPVDEVNFRQQLHLSLQHWQAQGKHGIWLKLSLANAKFVPIAVEAGFQYHHAESSHVMLTRWLPSTPSTLPPNASHQVGIGAFVLNDQRQVLAIQERNGPLKGLGVWKMPTGLVNEAEDVCAGAVREVKEETGVDTEFVEVIAIRQAHQMAFGKSDLFFLCALRPLSSVIVKQESEVEDAKWMDLDEFREQPFYADRELLRHMVDLCISHADGSYEGYRAEHYGAGKDRQPSVLYWNKSKI